MIDDQTLITITLVIAIVALILVLLAHFRIDYIMKVL